MGIRSRTHRVGRPRVTAAAIPDSTLVTGAFTSTDVTSRGLDLADAFRVPRAPGTSGDPTRWADAMFADPPRWAQALFVLRNVLVRPLGIEVGDASAFATVATCDDEVLLGTDAGHLDFRASVLVDSAHVTVTTLARVNNRRGRLYMGVVRHLHPVVVRGMLRRGARTMERAAQLRVAT